MSGIDQPNPRSEHIVRLWPVPAGEIHSRSQKESTNTQPVLCSPPRNLEMHTGNPSTPVRLFVLLTDRSQQMFSLDLFR